MNAEGVILAAGYSSRAGIFKMTMKLKDKTVIEHCICNMYDFCGKITVVTGHEANKLDFLMNIYDKVQLVFNESYDKGMFSSVLKGLSETNSDLVFIIPGDCPAAGKKVYKNLLKADGNIRVPCFNGMSGHPNLLSRRAIDELLLSSGNYVSLRDFLCHKGFTEVLSEDEGILMDIDNMRDFLEVKSHLNGQNN